MMWLVTGSRGELYRRCYEAERVCYQTNYETLASDDSTAECLRQGNLTRPVILSQSEADSIRDFITADPLHKLISGPTWLAAEARPLPDKTPVHWQWLDAGLTSMNVTYSMSTCCHVIIIGSAHQ